MQTKQAILSALFVWIGVSIDEPLVAQESATPEIKRVIKILPPNDLIRLAPPVPGTRPPSWHNVEQKLIVLRKQRKTWGWNYANTAEFYDWLATPASTGAASLEEHLKHLATWQAEIPDSAAARVVHAKALIKYAWEARGEDVAARVTPEGWRLFGERAAEAHRLLDEAVRIGVADGEAYARLIVVGMAEGLPREEVDKFVAEGMKVDPTYFSIYTQMAVYLLPRWMGEPGDIELFAAEIARKIPGDDGLEAYARMALEIQQYECGWGETLLRGDYDHAKLVRAAEVLLKRYPGSRTAHFAALCAMVAQDHEAAQRVRPLLGPFKREDKIWVWENDVSHFRNWAGAAEDPHGEESWAFAGLTGCTGIAFGNERRHVWVAQQLGRSAVNVMNVKTNQIDAALPHPGGVVNEFVFDPGRQWAVLSAWNGPFTGWMLWDVQRIPIPLEHATENMCRAVAIHPTRPQVYWVENGPIRSWNIETDAAGPEIAVKGAVHALRFSADGKWLIADNRIIDAVTSEYKFELPIVEAKTRPKIFPRHILTVDEEGRAWSTAAEAVAKEPKTMLVRFSADGNSWDTLLQDIGTGKAWLSPDRKLLATVPPISNGAAASRIEIWNIGKRERVKEFSGHWNSINELAFSPDGSKLASVAMWADKVKIWPLEGLAE
ncbi:MAG TPA: hypothetical protein VGI40_28600 [Pirellulaceae bacterium]|jgi:hypothetical protein